MKRKGIMLVLATAVLGFGLAGCGGAQTLDALETSSPSPAPTPEPTPEPPEFSVGQIDGSVYTNRFAGLTFTLPESWSFADEEDFRKMTENGGELSGEEPPEENAVYDMMAYDVDGSPNVFVMLEDLRAYEDGENVTESRYLDMLAEGLELVEEVAYEIGASYSMQIAGETYTAFDAESVLYGVVQSYCARRIGNYMVCICFTVDSGSSVDAVSDCFG